MRRRTTTTTRQRQERYIGGCIARLGIATGIFLGIYPGANEYPLVDNCRQMDIYEPGIIPNGSFARGKARQTRSGQLAGSPWAYRSDRDGEKGLVHPFILVR